MRPGSLHPRAYKMPSTSPIVLSGHYCCGGHCGLDCKRPWVNILGVKSSVRSPPLAVRPPPALQTTGGRGSPGRWVTGEPGAGGQGGVGHGGPPGSRDGEPRGSTGGEDSGQPVVGRASPRRGTTGNPGRGQRGCPRGTRPTGHSGTAAPRVIPRHGWPRGRTPERVTTGELGTGGHLVSLGLWGTRGSPAHGSRTGVPGTGAKWDLGTGTHGGERDAGETIRIDRTGHTGGYAMSRRGVCGGTIGVAGFIIPAQCPTRPFGHSLCYKRGTMSSTFPYVSHECGVPKTGTPNPRGMQRSRHPGIRWPENLGHRIRRQMPDIEGPLTSPRDLCWTLNTRSS